MLPSSLVVLNPTAHGGRARALWSWVEPEVASYSRPEVVCTDPAGHWTDTVHRARESGVRLFLAAGGDGTVNALVNALSTGDPSDGAAVEGASREPITLGAIGLGSSNDFHKPVGHRMGDVPLRVDPRHTRSRDVGLARYRDPEGQVQTRRFVISASMGLTAEANALFNGRGRTIRWLKRKSTDSAILYAALCTIAKHQSFPAELCIEGGDGRRMSVQLTSLSVMKTPFLSGWLRFDTPVEPDDGHFAVNLCDDLSRLDILRVLRELSRGRFLACRRAGTEHFRAAKLTVRASHPVALELDGEVVRATEVTFEMSSQQLRCCA